MAKVFISYSRKDIEFAKRLTEELAKSDVDYWIDWEGIPPTVDWWKEIEKGIEDSDAFLFIISPDSASSKVCGMEVDHAVKNGKRTIPLVANDIKGDEVPKQLSHLNWVFFREQDDFKASTQKILNAIQTDYEWVQAHRRLQSRALEWQRSYKEKSFLLRGKDLKAANAQFQANSTKEPHSTALQEEYLRRSRKAQSTQRMIIMAITIATALFITPFTTNSLNVANSWGNVSNNYRTFQTYYYSEKAKSAQHLAIITNFLLEEDPTDHTIPALLAVHALTDPYGYYDGYITTLNDDAMVILQKYTAQDSTSYRELIDSACAKLPRNLTQAEWKHYFGNNQLYEAACPNLPDGE